jgi:outer membrane cobalamin receptor
MRKKKAERSSARRIRAQSNNRYSNDARYRSRVLRLAMMSILAAPAMDAGAQEAGAAASEAPSSGALAEVIVTGSRIPQPNVQSTSPLAAVSGEQISLSGATGIEDVLGALPQVYVQQNSSLSNGATGTATVNLRNLGSVRTLVLVDGKRLMPGDPGSIPAPDLNNIPMALVERVDVVTGGASAVYGSDALAGVVNFIMKKNFDGATLDLTYDTNQHSNHSHAVEDLINESHAAAIPSSGFDGGVEQQTLIVDDSIEHEAWNDSDTLRAVLIFDIWHPDLRADERALIADLMAADDNFKDTSS